MKISRILNIQWKNVFSLSRELAKRSGRSPLDVFMDIISCYQKRGTSWQNYMCFGFHHVKDPEIRDSFVSEYKDNIYLNSRANSPAMIEILTDKGLFNKNYLEFLGRSFIDLRFSSEEDFLDFFKAQGQIIAKPADESGGSGIEKLSFIEGLNPYERLMEEKKYIVEEVLIQHPEMARLNPGSVNTVRTCTCIDKEGRVRILYMVLRIGRQDSFVDNMSGGGFYTRLSEEGEIISPCYSSKGYGTVYHKHPDTGFDFMGFKLPLVDELKDFALKLAAKFPEARYIGWDIALTSEGPVVIEGNERPGMDLPQTYIHLENGRGLAQEFQEALSERLDR